jgi:hypothetical protein
LGGIHRDDRTASEDPLGCWCLGVRGSITGNANPGDVPGNYFSSIALGVGLVLGMLLAGRRR